MKIKVNNLFAEDTDKSVDAEHVQETVSSKEFATVQVDVCMNAGHGAQVLL